jgi:cytochrome c oxidase cbb3-type subunit 3
MSNQKNQLPGWAIFPAALVLIIGILVGVYNKIFSKESTAIQYKELAGVLKVEAKLDLVIPPRTNDAIAGGEKLYSQVCAACHGQDLKGGVGPNLIDNEWRNPPAKETHLFKLVWNGIPNGNPPMPAKGGRSDLTSEQIWQILYYISSKNKNIEKDAVPNQ